MVSVDTTGGLDSASTPQIVVVTFQNAINSANVDTYTQLFQGQCLVGVRAYCKGNARGYARTIYVKSTYSSFLRLSALG